MRLCGICLVVMLAAGGVARAQAPLFSGGDVGVNRMDLEPLNPDRPPVGGMKRIEDMPVAQLEDFYNSLEFLATTNPIFRRLRNKAEQVLTRQGVIPEDTPADSGWQVRMTEKDLPGSAFRPRVAGSSSRVTPEFPPGAWYNDAEADRRNYLVLRGAGQGPQTRQTGRLYDTLTGRPISDRDEYLRRVGPGHDADNELANNDQPGTTAPAVAVPVSSMGAPAITE